MLLFFNFFYCWVVTDLLLKLCKSLADSILHKDDGLFVGMPLRALLQHTSDCVVQQRCGGCAVRIAGRERGNNWRSVHMNETGERGSCCKCQPTYSTGLKF